MEVRVITVKRGAMFHALAISETSTSGREVLDRSVSAKNTLAALVKLHDQTAAELADVFPDEVPDGVDIPAGSMTTTEEGNNDTPPPSPEGVERDWALATKEVVLERRTEEPGVAGEACMPQFGNPVCTDGIPAQTTQDDTTACPPTAQLTEVRKPQTPVVPEIPTEPAPVAAEDTEDPIASRARKKRGKKGHKGGKGKGTVVNKMVQAIEVIAVGTPDITEKPDPPPVLPTPPAPPSPPLPPLVQPGSPPRSPPSTPEGVAVPTVSTPFPSSRPFALYQPPPATSDHYLASHAWHAYPKSPSDNNDKTPPSLSSPIVASSSSPIVGALDILVHSTESLETPREKIKGILQVLGAVGRVLEGFVNGEGY